MIKVLAFIGAIETMGLLIVAAFFVLAWIMARRERKARERAYFKRVVFGKEE